VLSLSLFGIVLLGASILLVLFAGTWVIRENQSGLVIMKFGPELAAGRLIATSGEAGYQARLLPPGWHFGLWRWKYRVVKVPVVTVPPGEVALLVAADGASIPSERVLGRVVECDNFQDAEAFLRRGGERGRQLGFLTAGTYRINPALFQVVTAAVAPQFHMNPEQLKVFTIGPERVGIVTVLDGRPIPAGDLAGHPTAGHDSFQRGQAFIDAGGCRGLQEEVLMSGSFNLNPWFARVEQIPLVEVPIGYVGVVVSYVGQEHIDVSGDSFTHGDLVERGHKGVWAEPLLPGKHPINLRVMKVELVPTTNIVLNWAQRSEAHEYDKRLSSIAVRSRDGFSFTLDVATIIHVGARNAPRVISRVGSMQNLVDHVLQPTVGNYFRNSAQQVSVLEFLSARSSRQMEAYQRIKEAISSYDVECIDTLIGDIVPPESLMKTQTDRKIAQELELTYAAEREAQIKRQDLEREKANADLQAEVVRSEQLVRIHTQNALAAAEEAKGHAQATRLEAEAAADAELARAQAQAQAIRLRGDAEAEAIRATGSAKAEAYKQGQEALGPNAYTAVQLAQILGENHVKLVPEISLGAGQGAGSPQLLDVLVSRMLLGEGHQTTGSAAPKNGEATRSAAATDDTSA
jgi:uncharacterized membrane protein YqiK